MMRAGETRNSLNACYGMIQADRQHNYYMIDIFDVFPELTKILAIEKYIHLYIIAL